MKIEFPAGLILVQTLKQGANNRAEKFGVLMAIEWAEDTYVFTIGWSEGFAYVPKRVKLKDMSHLAIIPVTGSLALLDQVAPSKDSTLDELKAQQKELGNIVKIFDGYFRDMLNRHSALGERIADLESNNGHS